MCNQDRANSRYKPHSRSYERIKLEVAKLRSAEYKGRVSNSKGKPNPGASLYWSGRSRPELSERNRLRKGIPKKPMPPDWINPLKGAKQSEELIKKRAEARKAKGKPILQYTIDNNFIQEFRCISEAYEWLKSHGKSGDIRANLYGTTKKAGGYIWKYKN